MKRFLLTLITTLAFSLSVSAQEHTKRPPAVPNTSASTEVDNGGWVRFTSQTGRFTVLMPEMPTDKVETTPSEHGPYTTHLFIAKDSTSVYLIGWVDYDPNFNFNRQSELEANRDNFVKGIEATLLNSRFLNVDGYQALDFSAETPDRIFKSRVYMVGRRPYQIVIGSPKGVDDSVAFKRFFDSFKINK